MGEGRRLPSRHQADKLCPLPWDFHKGRNYSEGKGYTLGLKAGDDDGPQHRSPGPLVPRESTQWLFFIPHCFFLFSDLCHECWQPLLHSRSSQSRLEVSET